MFKLKYKVAIHVLLVSLPCVAAIGLFSHLTAKHHVHEMMDFEYMGSLNRVKYLIGTHLKHVEQDMRFLVNASSPRGMIRAAANNGFDPEKGLSFQQWERQLEDVFRQAVAAKEHYLGIAFIDSSGMELARVDHNGNAVRVVSKDELRHQASLSYFKQAMETGAGEFYISPLETGHDSGTHAAAHEPVIRYGAPVWSDDGNRIGLVVVDVLAQDLLDVKKMFAVFQMKDAGRVFIVDQKGSYLHRCREPEEAPDGECDIHGGRDLMKDYPEVASEILSGKEGVLFSGEKEIFYSSLEISEQLTLIIGFDTLKRIVEAPVREFNTFLAYIILGTLGLTWILSAFFARHLLRSIDTLNAATKRISRGDFQLELNVRSNDEIQELASGFSSMAQALRRKTERLSGLYELGISKGKSPISIAERAVSFIVSATGCRMATVERIDGDTRSIVSSCLDGGQFLNDGVFPLEGTPCAEVRKLKKVCHFECSSEEFPSDRLLRENSIERYVGVPIFSGAGEVMGIAALMDCRKSAAADEDIELLCTLSRLIAFEWERGAHIDQIKEASLDTIHRLSRAAEYRDEDTGMHLQRMSHYSAAIARRLGLKKRAVEAILYAAPMHDVGKIGIPDRILLKPGKFDPDEWEIMKQHTILGGKILEGSRIGFLKLARVIALTHHERWDGTGYPGGLKGPKIPLAGRITAVADVFDALTSKRLYKPAFPVGKAFALIREGRGAQFDPRVADAFFAIEDEILAIMARYQDHKESLLVQMNDGSHK
jgi:response regulator RpfG family c-di-GMP phosphodiesterase/HAMP domain-containing protein